MSETPFDPIEAFNAMACEVIGNTYVVATNYYISPDLSITAYNTVISLTLQAVDEARDLYSVQLVGDTCSAEATINGDEVRNIKKIIGIADNRVLCEFTNNTLHLLNLFPIDRRVQNTDAELLVDKYLEYTADIYQTKDERNTYQIALMQKMYHGIVTKEK